MMREPIFQCLWCKVKLKPMKMLDLLYCPKCGEKFKAVPNPNER